jgi:hypothetical protein
MGCCFCNSGGESMEFSWRDRLRWSSVQRRIGFVGDRGADIRWGVSQSARIVL